MVSLPSPEQSDYTGQKERYSSLETRTTIGADSKFKEAQEAQEYITPLRNYETSDSETSGRNITSCYGNRADTRTTPTKADEENTYQPLIPLRSTRSDDSKVYQSLTLPKTVNIPPSLPPKPGAKCTVKRAQSSVQRGWKVN